MGSPQHRSANDVADNGDGGGGTSRDAPCDSGLALMRVCLCSRQRQRRRGGRLRCRAFRRAHNGRRRAVAPVRASYHLQRPCGRWCSRRDRPPSDAAAVVRRHAARDDAARVFVAAGYERTVARTRTRPCARWLAATGDSRQRSGDTPHAALQSPHSEPVPPHRAAVPLAGRRSRPRRAVASTASHHHTPRGWRGGTAGHSGAIAPVKSQRAASRRLLGAPHAGERLLAHRGGEVGARTTQAGRPRRWRARIVAL